MLNGVSYQRCTIGVALGLPGFIFSVVFFLNLFVWYEGSTNAIPFGSMFGVIVLWLVCSVPLVFIGSFNGFKKDRIEFPVGIGVWRLSLTRARPFRPSSAGRAGVVADAPKQQLVSAHASPEGCP